MANTSRLVGIEYRPTCNSVVLYVEHSGTTRYIHGFDINEAIDVAAILAESGDVVVSEIVLAVASILTSLAPIVEKEKHANAHEFEPVDFTRLRHRPG